MSVIAQTEALVLPTYPVGKPEKNPVFFQKRVYQGSSGKVYPVPFIDKVYDEPIEVTYQSVRLENDFIRLVLLPEIGGRILIGQDKTNNDYDFFYRQDIIKPALVGLGGPWISGGVEFNWPQHHRPGTFMPADVHIEDEGNGVYTVWMSEHDPLDRLKGMHGIRLRPDSSLIELRARLYNRTPMTRTFLWWANVAAKVHDQYQSFFPPDVHYVADHAVRAMSSFPTALNDYYGIAYHERPGANDLSWYKNIPVPTSYMVCQTAFDFFGGYDFYSKGGFVHVANRHIAPGKKQWTWGDERFGHAWDRELTNEGGPYVELMAGVYTDNQPDFSYLLPYETKTFSQFWWPIQGIGPAQQATTRAALALTVREDRVIVLGLNVSESFKGELLIHRPSHAPARFAIVLKPGDVWSDTSLRFEGENPVELYAELRDESGSLVLDYRPIDANKLKREREVATEPPSPAATTSSDELFHIGEHLELYRHPTRSPEPYWQAALQRDPLDSRCHLALGKRYLKRGDLGQARKHLEAAITRLTSSHPNPSTGEAHYHLGLVLRLLGDFEQAYHYFYKATWNYEWRSSSYYQLATLDCKKRDWITALEHQAASLATNRDHNKAQTLQALILHRLGRDKEALSGLEQLLSVDALDHFAQVVRHLVTEKSIFIPSNSRNDAQTIIDLAFDFLEAGFEQEAIALIEAHQAQPIANVAVPNPLQKSPMTAYLKAFLTQEPTDLATARAALPDHFFPSRLEEMRVLEWSLNQPGPDPLAAYALGNFLYHHDRPADAHHIWEEAARSGASIPQLYRNLGLSSWNVHRDATKAPSYYAQARELDPSDARLISEADQLTKKLNRPLKERLEFLLQHRDLVLTRDDATVELITLLNLTGQPAEALTILQNRRFHPWEGGEGKVLRQYTDARLLLGRQALEEGHAKAALEHFNLAMETPDNLGEAYHPLQAKADVNYWKGISLRMLGHETEAIAAFQASSDEAGDFTDMAVAAHSPLSYYRGLSLMELGDMEASRQLFESLLCFAIKQLGQPATIDYFATSLPNLLVFEEDLQARRDTDACLLAALAHHGLRQPEEAAPYLNKVLAFDHSIPLALELKQKLQHLS